MGQRTMPPAQCQPAPTRGRLSAPCLLFTSLHLLLLLLQGAQAAIHIPKDYVTNDLKQPPVITYQTRSYTAFYQDDVSLRCEASGNPVPTYRWVKDGTLYVEESSITANETDDLKSYQGKYRCYVSNELGTAMSDEIELITDSTPILPKEKRVRKTVHEGDSVVLHCNPPNSSVTPYIHWMDRKLMHIPQSDRVTIGLDGNLYFANVLNKDTRDDYTCNAQYSAARTILPKEPISLHVTPSNMVVKSRRPHLHRPEGKRSQYLALRGEPLTLECIPHGLPTPTVTWTRKDGPLETSDLITVSRYNHRLEFREVLESDDGEYSCTASNTQGSITHSYTVTVEAAPYWTKVPENQRYAPGEMVKLDCQAEGIPTPNITWKINGIPITETDGDQRRSIVGGTLRLTNVRYGDTAVYQCEASNKHGTSLVNAFIHIVELPPQILTEDKVMYNLTEGSSVFLDCRAFGSPPPKITWQNEFGELALENARATQFANGSLQITDVMREDSGMYFCSVKNLSISATLAVMNRTRIINPPQDLHVPRGQAAVLQCEYQVDQELLDPTILWRKDNNKIMTSAQDDKYTVFENGSLKITDVQQKDAGSYSCEVMTKLDADKASGSITVVDKPDAPHSLRLSEKSSRSVTLSWIPGNENNSPVSEYVIEVREEMHGLSEVKRVSAEMNHLEIPLLPFCTYNFRVTAVNHIGTSDFSLPSESYTTPPAKPDKNPGSVRSESTDPKSMVITWEEVDRRHFNGPGFRYKVMWRQAAGQGPKWNEDFVSHPPFTVNNTDTFSAFEIKVQALNDLGHGPSPAPKLGHSGEDTPLKPPTGVAVNQYNDTAVTITWTAVDRESVRGHLLGYKIHLKRLGPHQEHHGNRKRLLERSREESWEIDVLRDEKEEKIVSGLEYYSNYQLSITAHNSKGEGPPSDPVHFNTPEGVPGAPTDLRCESPSQTKLSLHWNHPHKPNGVLRGYVLHYQAQGVDGSPSEVQMVTIHDPSLNNYTLDNLDSQSRYFFSLRAETHAGLGEEAKVNATTLLDGEPPNYVNATVGETSVNLSWVPGHRHRNVGFTIHYLRKSAGGEWEESEQVNSTQAFYELQGLQSGTEYVLEIRHKNITYWTQGLQTNGPRLSEVQNGFASQGWFIGLISAVVLLLLILLILCFIKRSRGGKYSVKDKEEGQVDSDARPMKDEAFGEYSSDNDEKRSISQPSLCPDSKRGSDDSLAEYGDSVDIQFNEDGSFIGQYSGRRDHHAHADRDSSGAASPTNPNMPRPSMSFPNSVTGILGGN
ncbi:neural cell adhesion molecule L1.1 isoform X2 [Astyanax mexicanus]|uniref:neural cell adhesion molecule L1.1 isoform X2 n=1 Tax=Astyanax mexicanus TaxID=7994 RepID=UPI0020CB22A1|nr:neural cell adhesion molecule L1.1 isoform X2 [Astyanax mexicanus]